MALDVASGSFLGPTATGNQSVTGVGFQPKALILFSGHDDTDPDGRHSNLSGVFGFAVSTSQRGTMCWADDDAESTSEVSQDFKTDRVIFVRKHGASGTVVGDADFVSFDADGFTLNWITDFGAVNIHYLVLGGADLTDAAVVNFTKATTTGNDSITGVGFQGDLVLLMGNTGVTAGTKEDHYSFFLGAAKSSSERWCSNGFSKDGAATSNTGRSQRTNRCIIKTDEDGTIISEADFVSMDTDGFSLNYLTANAVASEYFALVLKGGSYDLDSFNSATSTGNQSVTGVGFQPKGDFLSTFNAAASGSVLDNYFQTYGVGISATNRRMQWFQAEDAFSTTNVNSDLQTALLHRAYSGSSTIIAEADFVSQDSDGFTVDWNTVDAISREFLYFAMADAVQIVLPSPALATWVVPSPTVNLASGFTPSPALARWLVPSPTAQLSTTFIPMPATARWVVPSPNVTQGVRGIGGDLIVTDVIEKTVIVPD